MQKQQPRCSVKKWECVLKFRKIHRKTPALETFLIKKDLQPASFLKRDSNTSAFLWSLRNFSEHLFWRTSASGCFRRCSIKKLFLKFCNIHRTKVPSDMCYMKKVFLVVAWSYNTKRYSWWLIELWKWRVFISINVSCKSSRLNGLFFP